MDRERKNRGWLAVIVGGAAVAASALRRPAIERAWTVALGLTCVAIGCFGYGYSWRLSAALERLQDLGATPPANDIDDIDGIDRASADSFPASDAPSSSTTAFALRR